MSEAGEAVKAVGTLGLGGLLFLIIGASVSDSSSLASSFIDLRLWGMIYLAAAVVLAGSLVTVAIRALLS